MENSNVFLWVKAAIAAAAALPLAVKALALENILLRVQAALRPANQETPQQPAE